MAELITKDDVREYVANAVHYHGGQERLAEHCGVCTSTICLILMGGALPMRTRTLEAIAGPCDIDLEFLREQKRKAASK